MAHFKLGDFDAHPTKGFRAMARPRKANSRRRRKLIPVGALALRKCHERNVQDKFYASGRWPKLSLAERRRMAGLTS